MGFMEEKGNVGRTLGRTMHKRRDKQKKEGGQKGCRLRGLEGWGD